MMLHHQHVFRYRDELNNSMDDTSGQDDDDVSSHIPVQNFPSYAPLIFPSLFISLAISIVC